MTDYAALTDEQLNRAVAERQGYVRFEQFRYNDWRMYDAMDKWTLMPSWASSIDAAAALDFGGRFVTIIYGNRKTVQVASPDGLAAYIEQDTRPEARLRTEAWLAYMDATAQS